MKNYCILFLVGVSLYGQMPERLPVRIHGAVTVERISRKNPIVTTLRLPVRRTTLSNTYLRIPATRITPQAYTQLRKPIVNHAIELLPPRRLPQKIKTPTTPNVQRLKPHIVVPLKTTPTRKESHTVVHTYTSERLKPEYKPVVLINVGSSPYFQRGMNALKQARALTEQEASFRTTDFRTKPYIPLTQTSSQIIDYLQAINYFVLTYKKIATSQGTYISIEIDGKYHNNLVVAAIQELQQVLLDHAFLLQSYIEYYRNNGASYLTFYNYIPDLIVNYNNIMNALASTVNKNWDLLYDPFIANFRQLICSLYSIIIYDAAKLANKLTSVSQAGGISNNMLSYVVKGQSYIDTYWQPQFSTSLYGDGQQAYNAIHSDLFTIMYSISQNILSSLTAMPGDPTISVFVSVNNPLMNALKSALLYGNNALQLVHYVPSFSKTSFQTTISNLQQGYSLLSGLQKASLSETTLQTLNTAVQPFINGQAPWLASEISTYSAYQNGKLNLTQAMQAVQQFTIPTSSEINSFIAGNPSSSLINKSARFFSGLASLQSLIGTGNTAYYSLAQQALEGAMNAVSTFSNGPFLSQAQMAWGSSALAQVQYIIQMISSITQGAESFSSGIVLITNPASVTKATELINQALNYFNAADSLYTTQSSIGTYFPFYSAGFSLAEFASLYAAYLYEAHSQPYLAKTYSLVKQLKQKSLNEAALRTSLLTNDMNYALYMVNALTLSYLPKAALSTISNSLQNLAQTLHTIAATSVQNARSQPSTVSWTHATQVAFGAFLSERLLKQNLTLNADLYYSTLQQCLSFAQQQNNRALQITTTYQIDLYNVVTTGVQKNSTNDPLTQFIQQGLSLQTQKTGKSYTQQVALQKQLLQWADQANTLVRDMKSIQNQYAPLVNQTSPFQRVTQGLVTYYKLANSSLSISIHADALGQLYQNLGYELATSASKGSYNPHLLSGAVCFASSYPTIDNHNQALEAFQNAQTEFQNLGMTSNAEAMQQESSIESQLLQLFLNQVVPILQVPSHDPFVKYAKITNPLYAGYVLSPYVLSIPQGIPVIPASLPNHLQAFIKSTTNALPFEQDVITLLSAMQLYNLLDANYASFVSAVPLPPSASLVWAVTTPGAVNTVPQFKNNITQALQYKNNLSQWLKGIRLNFSGFSPVNTALALGFYTPPKGYSRPLLCNLPVQPVTLINPPGQPITVSKGMAITASTVYAYQLQLLNQLNLASKDPRYAYVSSMKSMLETYNNNLYLSEAYILLKKAKYMAGMINDEKFVMFTSEVSEFQNIQNTRQILQQTNPATIGNLDKAPAALISALEATIDYFLLAKLYVSMFMSTGAPQNAAGLIASIYDQLGDFLSAWVVGDPRSNLFQQFISKLLDYGQSFGYYSIASSLYGDTGFTTEKNNALRKNADLNYKIGRMYAAENISWFVPSATSSIAATTYFNQAAGFYKQLQQTTLERLCQLNVVAALFRNGVANFETWYAQRWSSPTSTTCVNNPNPSLPETTIQLPNSSCCANPPCSPPFLFPNDSSAGLSESGRGSVFCQLLSDIAAGPQNNFEPNTYTALNNVILNGILYISTVNDVINNLAKAWNIKVTSKIIGSTGQSTRQLQMPEVTKYLAAINQQVHTSVGTQITTTINNPYNQNQFGSSITINATAENAVIYGLLSAPGIGGSLALRLRDFLCGLLFNSAYFVHGVYMPLSFPNVHQSVNQLQEQDPLLAIVNNQLPVAVQVMYDWSSWVYVTLSQCYANDIEIQSCQNESVTACWENTVSDMESLLQVQAQSILSPAEQYFGSY